jgi:2-phospho-L-lactate guanylyltransferase
MDTSPAPHSGEQLASPLDDRVAAVVALKTLPVAKSRFSSLPGPLRERLARCMALDTLAALRPAVDELVVVSDQPDLGPALGRRGLDVRLLAEPDPVAGATAPDDGLNAALARADTVLRAEGVVAVLACVGDLPALRSSTVRRLITASRGRPRSLVSDHDGQGTTMLIARGVPLDPLYGTTVVAGERIGSAARHRLSGAADLPLGALLDARRDVDTPADLAVAAGLGVGPATSRLLDPLTGALGDYLPVEVLSADPSTVTVLVDGGGVEAVSLPVSLPTYDGDPALLVPGRRLHAVRVADDLRCWI